MCVGARARARARACVCLCACVRAGVCSDNCVCVCMHAIVCAAASNQEPVKPYHVLWPYPGLYADTPEDGERQAKRAARESAEREEREAYQRDASLGMYGTRGLGEAAGCGNLARMKVRVDASWLSSPSSPGSQLRCVCGGSRFASHVGGWIVCRSASRKARM